MTIPARRTAAELSASDWEVLATAIAQLEDAWQRTGAADLVRLLPAADTALRELVLVELIKVDQEFRAQAGRPKALEAYLDDWPELRACPEALVELIGAEYLNRALTDPPPTPAEWQARFPEVASRVDWAQLAAVLQAESRSGAPPRVAPPGIRDTAEDSLAETVVVPAVTPPFAPGQRLGRYEVRAELGRGGMGTVYRAFDTQLEREVALKIPLCDPRRERAMVERFVQEGKAAARIQHPHVCPIYDAGCWGGTYFLAMALIEGQSLTQRMKEHPPAPAEAATLVRKLAAALQAVHDQGLVHRDIKPSNVMVTPQGEPLLMDFGLARRLDGAGGQTTSGMLVGTIPYMSPEQVNGEPVDRRSDVYSLGVVFYQLLAGQLPFRGKLTDLIASIGHAVPAKPSSLRAGVDPQLEAICLKAMAKRPDERYPSAAAFAAALEAGHGPPRTPPARFPRRTLAAGLGALALLAAMAVLVVGSVWGNRPARDAGVATATGGPSAAQPGNAGGALPELKVEFHLQRRTQRGGWEQLTPAAMPLQDGDRVQLHVGLNRAAYVYVYWFDHAGQAQRLYPPPDVPVAEHRPVRRATVPPDADSGPEASWLELQDMRGAETVFVGACDTPRTASELRQLEATYRVPERSAADQRLVAFSYPAGQADLERGPGRVVVGPKDTEPLLGPFGAALRQQFAEYRGWVLVND